VDDLLTFGVREITVLDLSPASLDVARRRLGERSEKVSWIAADITTFDVAPGSFDLVHDRAALHFLVNPADPLKYVDVVTRALPIGGCAVIGCFSRTGPEKCSGLPVARRNPEDLADLFGANFSLIEGRLEPHHTPGGSTQQFAYALLRKIS
jgi:SAM-dependent methyltransferase